MKKIILIATLIGGIILNANAWKCPDCDHVFSDGNTNGDRSINTADVTYIYNRIISGSGSTNDDIITSINLSYRGKFMSMLFVEGGTFNMGNPKANEYNNYWEMPVHQVTLANYYMGQTEMYNDFYGAIMGEDYVFNTGYEKYPVSNIEYSDIEKFLKKANEVLSTQLQGYELRLPTEAEWEFAARGGKKSKGNIYSGWKTIDYAGWYSENSNNELHPYAQKFANELRLSDMSGNVAEICSDYYDLDYYQNSPAVNPQGPRQGTTHIMRGGSYFADADRCTVYARSSHKSFCYPDQGFRLALSAKDDRFFECPDCGHRFLYGDANGDGVLNTADVTYVYGAIINGGDVGDDVDNGNSYEPTDATYTVGNVSFEMKRVEGGTFIMGAVSTDPYKFDDEEPRHTVTVNSFAMGETEVTQLLWEAVMGSNPLEEDDFYDPSIYVDSYKPVSNISYNDAEEFCNKLTTALKSQLNGAKFRLPTEAEWEYAARGGKKSNSYLYSGSNTSNDVAWHNGNSEGNYWTGTTLRSTKMAHKVKNKKANELGLYDMSGNVSEWCKDYYSVGFYYGNMPNNPCNTSNSGAGWVVRGGNWGSNETYARCSARDYATGASSRIGLRVVLSK